jgi:pimeloyl-[acyl-carrier protein] methyl ester esterase
MTQLVILPGTDGTGALLEDFLAAAADLRPLVLPYPIDRALDYAGLLPDLEPRLPRTGEYVLLGESFGGPLALALAARRPAGLVGVVLCASFARFPRPPLRFLGRLAVRMPPRWVPMPVAVRALLGRWASPRWRERLRDVLARVPSEVLQARVQATLDVDVTASLARLEVPLLYLQASDDRLIPAAAGEAIVAAVPSGSLVRIAGPHFLLQAAPVACAAAVRRFVRECAPPG